MKRNILLFASVIIILSIFSNCQKEEKIPENITDLDLLVSYMTGSFSSQEQAEADSNFFDIRLEMVKIWDKSVDTAWLYIEQAAAWSLTKPYRQRIYRVRQLDNNTFESAVFTFNNPLRYAGHWRIKDPLSSLSPDSLFEREGCTIILKKKENYFEGSTTDENCTSSLRGASYATSEVKILNDLLMSWDRGFDSTGVQVWGAEFGPYIFKKIKDYR